MNASEVCVAAPLADVRLALDSSPVVLSTREESPGVIRVSLVGDSAVANLGDDVQDGYEVSIFVFDPANTAAAKRLFEALAAATAWGMELRDGDTGETVARRSTVAA